MKIQIAVCTVTFTQMWTDGVPTRIIAETLGISADKADCTRRTLKLPRRESWHGAKSSRRTAYLPSEAEIEQKCLMFQARWTPEERERRRVGPSVRPVEATVVPESLFENSHGEGTSG